MEWQPIETAPKDGSRVRLWRGPAPIGVWAEEVIAEWHDGEWRWPDPNRNPSNHGLWTADDLDWGFASNEDFTFWAPLSPPDAEKSPSR